MSRIAIFADGVLPWESRTSDGLTRRPWQFAQIAAHRGHQVALIVLRPQEHGGWRHQFVTRAEHEGVTVYWVNEHLCHERPEVVHRIMHREAPECVIGIGVFPSSVAVNFCGEAPLWADFDHEPLAEAQVRAAPDEHAAITDAVGHFTPVLRRADRISCCTERQRLGLLAQLGLLGRLTNARRHHPFVVRIPHVVAADEVDLLRSVPRIQPDPADARIILSSGSYTGSTDFEAMAAVIERLFAKVPTARFLAIGKVSPGHHPAPYEAFRHRLKQGEFRHRVTFQQPPVLSEYPAYYASAAAALLIDQHTPDAIFGSRPQLVEWMAAGLPIVSARSGEQTDRFEQASVILGANSGDVDGLVHQLERLADDPNLGADLASQGRLFVEEHLLSSNACGPVIEFCEHPVRAPEANSTVTMRPITHPVERVRQHAARARLELRDLGLRKVALKTADFLARRARARLGKILARRGYDPGIPTIDTAIDQSGPQVGCPSHSATYWEHRASSYERRPSIRIILAVPPEADPLLLSRTFDHLTRQYYRQFHLIAALAPDCSTELRDRVESLLAEMRGHAFEASLQQGGKIFTVDTLADSDCVMLLHSGTLLRADALAELVDTALERRADLTYADEVQVDAASGATQRVCRPKWSPDFLLSYPYIGQPALYAARLLQHCRDAEITQTAEALDYLLSLTAMEHAERVEHIPQPLCWHWSPEGQSLEGRVQAQQQMNLERERYLMQSVWRRGLDAVVERGNRPGSFRVRYAITGQPKVSVLVATRDRLDLLQPCIESVERRSTYRNLELLIIDNGSTDPDTLEFLRRSRHRVLRYDEPFNFSRLHNKAIWEATGEYVVLLNNDTEVITPDWVESLLEHAQRPEVGAVGAKLIRFDGSIQHAGIVLTSKGFLYAQDWYREHGHDAFEDVVRNYLAVTAACMMIRRELYLGVNGLDERFAVAYNDIDLCLRLLKLGLRNVYTPHAVLYHHESASRGHGRQPAEDDHLLAARWLRTLGTDAYLGALGARTDSGRSAFDSTAMASIAAEPIES